MFYSFAVSKRERFVRDDVANMHQVILCLKLMKCNELQVVAGIVIPISTAFVP